MRNPHEYIVAVCNKCGTELRCTRNAIPLLSCSCGSKDIREEPDRPKDKGMKKYLKDQEEKEMHPIISIIICLVVLLLIMYAVLFSIVALQKLIK